MEPTIRDSLTHTLLGLYFKQEEWPVLRLTTPTAMVSPEALQNLHRCLSPQIKQTETKQTYSVLPLLIGSSETWLLHFNPLLCRCHLRTAFLIQVQEMKDWRRTSGTISPNSLLIYYNWSKSVLCSTVISLRCMTWYHWNMWPLHS